jgi:hypothetical protein
MPSLPTNYPLVITVENSDGFSPSVMFPRESFFFARVSVCKTVGGLFFLFAKELATEREFTDDYYIDGRVPSVIISPTEFIPFTDRINSSIKLFNGVVTQGSLGSSYVGILGDQMSECQMLRQVKYP